MGWSARSATWLCLGSLAVPCAQLLWPLPAFGEEVVELCSAPLPFRLEVVIRTATEGDKQPEGGPHRPHAASPSRAGHVWVCGAWARSLVPAPGLMAGGRSSFM